MERIRDSTRASCSSSFSLPAGFPFKRRPTSQINDEYGQADLLKETATIPDRAARKEIERQRLRKLLNQGKKKRRRLNSNKIIASPRNGATVDYVDDFQRGGTTSFSHCHSISNVPRKSRSVGNRRKGNSWVSCLQRSIGFDAQVQLPIPSKSSPSPSVEDEIEIEFEIAEVLYGLKKQVSSSDDPPTNDLENEENQSTSVQGCGIDEAVTKQQVFTAEEGYILSSNPASNGSNLTSEVLAAPMEESESKRPEKFVIDLNEPPPMESSLEGEGMEGSTSNTHIVFKEEVNLVHEETTIRRFVQKEMTDENHLPWKMEIKGELQKAYSNTSIASDLQFCSHKARQENNSRPVKTPRITDKYAQQIHMPLQAGRMMAGPLTSPPSQNQNVRYSYPIGARFLSVLPGNVCTSPSSDGKRMHFLDGQLHPSQKILPIQIQEQKYLPFTTRAVSQFADIRTFGGQRTVMPSASSGDGGQWQYTEKHDLKSGGTQNSASSFSFASSTQRSPFDAAGLFSGTQNPVMVPSFLDKTNSVSGILPADHGLQHRNYGMIQKSSKAGSTYSSASMEAKVFDTSNGKLSYAKQNSFAKFRLSSSNPSGASRNNPTSFQLQNPQQQVLQVVPTVNNQQQPPLAAKLSNDFSIFSFDRSSHSLQQQTSDSKQSSDVLHTSVSPLCNLTLHNPPRQKLTIPSSHIQI